MSRQKQSLQSTLRSQVSSNLIYELNNDHSKKVNNFTNPNASTNKHKGYLSHHRRRILNHGGGPSFAEKESSISKTGSSVMTG